MQRIHFLLDIFQGNSTHTAYRVGKIPVDHVPVNADGLKDLGALIGLNRGYPHLGGNLNNTVENRVVIIVHRRIVILIQHMIVNQLLDALLRQIRIDCRRAKAKQGCKMMHFPRLSRLQNDVHAGSLSGVDQMLLQSRHGKQGGNRHSVFIHSSVRENDNICALAVSPVNLHKKPVDGLFQSGVLIIGYGNNFHLKAFRLHGLDLQKVRACENGIVHTEHVAVLRHFLQKIAVPPQIYGGGCNHLLADRVNGRIGHLGKKLLKIMEQRVMRFGEHRDRRIHTHGRNGLRSASGHRQNAGLQILIGIAKRFLHALSLFISKFRHTLIGNL